MNGFNKIARWLFIACLPPFFLSAAIAITVNLPPLYSYGFERYNIADVTGIEKDQLEVAATSLRGYFNSDEEYISVTVIRNGEPFGPGRHDGSNQRGYIGRVGSLCCSRSGCEIGSAGL